MKRTLAQNKRLYGLFTELNITGDLKADMVLQFTGDRTERSSEMEYNECNNLICTLEDEINKQFRQSNEQRQRMRRQVFVLMYNIGVIEGDMQNAEKMRIINAWIFQRMGQLDKDLNTLNVAELTKFITILQTVKRRYAERSVAKAQLN